METQQTTRPMPKSRYQYTIDDECKGLLGIIVNTDELIEIALKTVCEKRLGNIEHNPDDHAHFYFRGWLYTVQQIAPGKYMVFYAETMPAITIAHIIDLVKTGELGYKFRECVSQTPECCSREIRPNPSRDDIFLWPDDASCRREEWDRGEMSDRSDDYIVVPVYSNQHEMVCDGLISYDDLTIRQQKKMIAD